MADDGSAEGELKAFKGAGHISAKAARAILPHLARGLVYSRPAPKPATTTRAAALSALDVDGARGVEAIRRCCARKTRPVGCTR